MKDFDNELTDDNFVFTNFAAFDFKSNCVQSSTIADTETTTWVVEHEPVFRTSILLEEPTNKCDIEPNRWCLVPYFLLKSLQRKVN